MFLRTSDKQSMSKKQEHKWSLFGGVIFAVVNFLLVWPRLIYLCSQGDEFLCEDSYFNVFFINFPTSAILSTLIDLPVLFFYKYLPSTIVQTYVMYSQHFTLFISGLIQYFALGVLFGFVAYKIFNYAKSKRSGNKA